jgi:hypothetical protein
MVLLKSTTWESPLRLQPYVRRSKTIRNLKEKWERRDEKFIEVIGPMEN